MVNWNNDEPLAICEDEPIRANALLQAYYQLGFNRSLDRLSKLEGTEVTLRTLQNYSVTYDWQNRIRRQHELDSVQIKTELREAKTAILQEFAKMVYSAIAFANTEGASISQVASATKALFDCFALNFDEMPTHRTLNLTDLTFESVLEEMRKNVEKDVFA